MTTLNAYGDSITKGDQVSRSFPVIFGKKMGWLVNNYGINGARAADIADAVFSTSISATTKNILAIGVNNVDNDLPGTSAATFKLEHLSLAARLSVPDSAKKFANDPSILYAGPWLSDPALSGIMYTSTSNSTATFQFDGDVVYLGYVMSNLGGGKASVKIDGITISGVMDSNSYGAVSSYASRDYSPSFLRVSGCGAGTHTCKITTLNANSYFRFSYFSTPVSGPEVFVHNITRVYTSTLQPFYDVYNNAIASNIALLQADGLSVRAIDAGGSISATRDLIDGIHPNQLGHYKIANSDIIAAGGAQNEIFVPLHTYIGIDGNLYAGNDYDKYLIKSGPL